MSNQQYYGPPGPQYPPASYGPPPQGYQGYPPPQAYPPQGYPPQGYPPQGYAPQPQYQPQKSRSSDKGCLGTCLAALCCCFVCEEGCECCADCIECCEMC